MREQQLIYMSEDTARTVGDSGFPGLVHRRNLEAGGTGEMSGAVETPVLHGASARAQERGGAGGC